MTDGRTDKQTDRRTGKQTDIQTDGSDLIGRCPTNFIYSTEATKCEGNPSDSKIVTQMSIMEIKNILEILSYLKSFTYFFRIKLKMFFAGL